VSTPAEPASDAASSCALCGSPIAPGVTRCPSCGLHQQLGAREPNPFTRGSLWALAGVLLAVYVVALVVVSLAR